MADVGNRRSRSPAIGLSRVPSAGPAPRGVRTCPANTLLHTVVVKALWRDTREAVPAVACRILLGDAAVHPGPLAGGTMGQGGLVGGSYEVTLPEVDEDEWDAE
ncbi:MAG: hypothetical protein KF683_13610 [Rubrivivax sp.]|nr:hypothetical protein [Rubrivivax sp.]